jgi:hypothetical protein
MYRKVRTLAAVIITLFAASNVTAQTWQNATTSTGVLPVADFSMCQHRLSILALPTAGTTSAPSFRTYYLTAAIGTAQGTNPLIGGLRTTISANDFDVLRQFMSQTARLDLNRPAALNVRPNMFPSPGFTVSINQGGPSGVVGVVPQPEIPLTAVPPFTFFVEKNCAPAQSTGGQLIVGSAVKTTQPPYPPSTTPTNILRASFNFPYSGSNGSTFRFVATSIYGAVDLPFNNNGQSFYSSGGMYTGNLSISRTTPGGTSGQVSWNGNYGFATPGPFPSTGPISISLFLIATGPNGDRVIGSTVLTTPN